MNNENKRTARGVEMEKKKFQVGYSEAGLIKRIYWEVKTVLSTWLYCKKHGYDFRKWYGVFIDGTNMKICTTGCLPDAEDRALKIFFMFEQDNSIIQQEQS